MQTQNYKDLGGLRFNSYPYEDDGDICFGDFVRDIPGIIVAIPIVGAYYIGEKIAGLFKKRFKPSQLEKEDENFN